MKAQDVLLAVLAFASVAGLGYVVMKRTASAAAPSSSSGGFALPAGVSSWWEYTAPGLATPNFDMADGV